MFRLLKLKPPHGWVAVAWELAIVTLGVLIALAAQQLAEELNERREAAATRAALVGEIEESLAILELRKSAEPCVDRRLSELSNIVERWGRTGSFVTPRWVAQAPWYTLDNLRVDAAVSAGRFPLLSNEEQFRFGLVAGSIRTFREIQAAETDVWAKLRLLQSGPEGLSKTDRTAIRLALQEASVLNYRMKVTVTNTLPVAASYGWKPNARRARQFVARGYRNGRVTPSICIGIDTPPEEANANLVLPLPR